MSTDSQQLHNEVIEHLLTDTKKAGTKVFLPHLVTPDLNLSPDQLAVFAGCIDWLNNPSGTHLSIGGYAGTGKTTLIGVLRKYIAQHDPKKRVAFACFTGQASQNLATKLQEQQAVFENKDTNGTIHSLMYTAQIDKEGRITSWKRTEKILYDLIIVDEASMVTQDIWMDLVGYGIPIVAFGDHGQLPPIADSFNLMEKPHLRLETLHRHAEGNPIIHLATLARTGQPIPFERFSSTVKKVERSSEEASDLMERFFSTFSDETLVLCGSNKTRVALNKQVRAALGIESEDVVKGDRVVCLKNKYDNADGIIYNGMVGRVTQIRPEGEHWYAATVEFGQEGKTYQGKMSRHQFNSQKALEGVPNVHFSAIGDRFDFGYAVTVHKAQGSQAPRTLLFDESYLFRENAARWLYTAITRAQSELYIFE